MWLRGYSVRSLVYPRYCPLQWLSAQRMVIMIGHEDKLHRFLHRAMVRVRAMGQAAAQIGACGVAPDNDRRRYAGLFPPKTKKYR